MPLTDTVYEALTDDDETRVCAGVPDSACREAPHSFTLILFTYVLTKLGDAIASPKTTLAWVCTSLGTPAYVLGFLVPIRESGSMIPQLFIGSAIRRLPVRKWTWVIGSIGQCAAVAGIGAVALYLDGARAGWAILALISVFSLARAFCSVAAKDVMGKTIPRPKRGQLTGWSASAAGLISVGVGVVLMLSLSEDGDTGVLGWLLIVAGLLWVIAAAVYAQVPEYPGETGGGRSGVDAIRLLRIVLDDRPFRRFVVTRALLMCSALSAPFYIALAQTTFGSPAYLLGAFVAAAGVANLVSGPIWGRFADASSKHVMITAALVTSGIGLTVFATERLAGGLAQQAWFLPLAYFVLSVAHSGVRVGRKTYVVNLGSGNQRTDYVTVSNTLIGILLLLAGSVGALAPILTNAGVIGLLAFMALTGAALGTSLPQAEG